MHCDECNGTGHNLGSLDVDYPENCPVCDGYGVIEYAIGARVVVCDENAPEQTVRATVTDVTPNGWYEIHIDGQDDDLPSVDPSLVAGKTGEPLASLETVAALVARVIAPRKPAGNEHVAPVFAEILNAFGGVR